MTRPHGPLLVASTTALALLVGSSSSLAQVRPPALTSITPYGLQRGTAVTFTVEGTSLAEATEVLLSDAGLSARIIGHQDGGPDVPQRRPEDTSPPIRDRARKSVLTLEITAGPEVPIGRQGFRVRTPLGTSTFMPLWVGDLEEIGEREPNDTPAQAQRVTTPVTVNGVLAEEGDRDTFRLSARAGEEVVVRVTAVDLGSRLDAVLTLLDADGREIDRNDDFGDTRDPLLVFSPPHDGDFVVAVTDTLGTGSARHVYRLTIGAVPFLTRAFPLGAQHGTAARVRIEGANLDGRHVARLGSPRADRPDRAPLVVAGLAREPINRLDVAVGVHPEIEEHEPETDELHAAQPVTLPVTVNGRLHRSDGSADEDHFRFEARAGEQVVVTVLANRAGSPLDSIVEVLDSEGREIPRAVLRPVWQTSVDLRHHGSLQRGIRLLSYAGLARGDFVYIDRELVQVDELPKGPDEDTFFTAFRGTRVAFEETTPEGHANGRPVYKVEIHPPGAAFSPNGLPTFHLTYRNDDGGPTWGKDSRVTFTAPETGRYVVRLRDARGESGPEYAYRLTLAAPSPDFELYVTPTNPNVARGGRVPVTVHAYRHDGFDGPIGVEVTDLPAGLSASRGVILPGHSSVALTLEASPDAGAVTTPLRVVGRGRATGRDLVRQARADERISVIAVAEAPEVRVVSVEPAEIELAPGGRARVRATIARDRGFAGRVPLAVLNLPQRVTVPDIGLNGILITEAHDSREFEIVVDEGVEPSEQTLFVTARVETNQVGSPEQASAPIRLRIRPTPHAALEP